MLKSAPEEHADGFCTLGYISRFFYCSLTVRQDKWQVSNYQLLD